ncbi:hypothetical protein [Thermomonospora cellulosilytica]|uniref:Uncharacterized protein n=1 Tax=Thermomonospora cellulosilytica TaxID=1411118 RepID=A0A7W3MVN6_9ACTN|nr:hypothetical protein [Thermomonospora cellulosilytica]MBA9002754.1 hypothetical protein [Thermomonospora cellulosilytica]
MTGQIPDEVTYQGKSYALAGANGTGLFDPTALGLRVRPISTACWRGYLAEYAIVDGALKLTGLRLGLDDERPEVFGVLPDEPEDPEEVHDLLPDGSAGSADYVDPNPKYSGLDVPVPFTGGLLIGRDFDSGFYVHMGFQAGWKYADLHELIFVGAA